MEERTFTWFPKLTRVMEALPPENVAEFAMAVVRYGTYGEEPELSSPLLAAVFEGVREDVDNSVNARTKNKGGRPPKNPRENGGSDARETEKTGVSEISKPENGGFGTSESSKTGVSDVSETSKRGLCEVSETENPPYISQAIPNQTIPSQDKPGHNPPNPPAGDLDDSEEFAAFAVACIDAFNAETGQDYRSSGGRDWLDLRRVWDNGRTVDDVRAVVRSKLRDWGRDPKMRKFVRPSTLFGPKFEEYLAECGPIKAAEGEPCPDCGRPMVPIGDVIEKPKDPSRMWCERCRKAHGGKGAEA